MNKINHLILAFVTVFASLSSSAMETAQTPVGLENLPKYVVSPYYNPNIVNFGTLTWPKLTKLGWYTPAEQTLVDNFKQAQALESECAAKLLAGIPSPKNALEGLSNKQIVALLDTRVEQLTVLKAALEPVLERAAAAAVGIAPQNGVRLEIATLLGKLGVEIDAISQVAQGLMPKKEVQQWTNPFAASAANVSSLPLLTGSSEDKHTQNVRPMAQDAIASFMDKVGEDSLRKDQMLAALKLELDSLQAKIDGIAEKSDGITGKSDTTIAKSDEILAKIAAILAHHENPAMNPKLVAELASTAMLAKVKTRELEFANGELSTKIDGQEKVIEGLRTSKSRRNWVIGLMTVGIGAMGYYLVPSEVLLAAQTLATETAQTLATEVGKSEAFATVVRYLAAI